MRKAVDDAYEVAESAKTSADLAFKEFVASHRPRIVVRKFAPIKSEGRVTGISYAIHNVGDGPGTVVAISGKVWFPHRGENLPAIPEYPAPIPRSDTLKSGGWIQCQHFADEMTQQEFSFSFGFMKAVADNPDSQNPSLLFLGYVDYVDEAGRKRQTAFLRQFDFKAGRFGPIEHPDYEYQD
jgi:hypothetical protein